MSLPKARQATSTICGTVYDNLAISSTVFLASPLPLDAKVTADLALLARSRAILFTATAMYLIDLNGGSACQPPAITQAALLRANRDIARHLRTCISKTSRRAPGGQMFDELVEGLLHMEPESYPSMLGDTWTGWLRKLLSKAQEELGRYETFLVEVRGRAIEEEIEQWLSLTGGHTWRARHDAAFAKLNEWYSPRKAPPGALGVWQSRFQSIRGRWNGPTSAS